jgi:hypothetical protein
MTLNIGHSRKIIVTSGRPSPLQLVGFLTIGAFFAIYAVPALHRAGNTMFSIVFMAITVLVVFITLRSWSLRWTIDIDAVAKRLRIERALLGYWRKAIADWSFDECKALGVRKSRNVEGPYTYSIYVQLRGGEQYAISVAGSAQQEAERIADELTNATGIPRLDISA